MKALGKGKKRSYEIDYEGLTQKQVESLMQNDIDHISAIFGVEVRGYQVSIETIVEFLPILH